TRFSRDWSSDVCSSDLQVQMHFPARQGDAVDGGRQIGGQCGGFAVDLRLGNEGVVAGAHLLTAVVVAVPDEVHGAGGPVAHRHGLHQVALLVIDLDGQVGAVGRHHHVAGHA